MSFELDITSWMRGDGPQDDLALIVLNQPIVRKDLFDKAWKSCRRHIVTDGAANHLKKLDRPDYIPDLIIGDFDSLEPETRQFYADQNVDFVQDQDQYATDLMKAMRESAKKWPSIATFLGFGGLGGRVDHSWHSYLCLSIADRSNHTLILVSDQNVTVLIKPGQTTVSTPRLLLGPTCGYFPLEGTTSVTTNGLEWDVDDWQLSITERLSTSNHLMSDEVRILTNKPLMLTAELR